MQDGRLVLFERPGLGLELYPTALKKFALVTSRYSASPNWIEL